MNLRKAIPSLLASLILIIAATARSSTAPVIIPNPVLVLRGQEPYTANGKPWTSYSFFVENFADFEGAFRSGAKPPTVWEKHQSLPHVGRFLRCHREKAQRILRARQTR